MRYTWIALVAAAFLAACGTVEAAASEAPAATPPAAPAATLTPAEHYAKGEVLYDKEWLPIDRLFKEYLQSRHELDRAGKRGDDVRGRLEDLQRELAQVKGEVSETERPVRAELSKARNKLRDYSRTLAKKAPVKPQLREIPPAPAASSYSSSNNRGDTRYGTSGSSNNNNDDRRRAWREKADAIKRENDQAMKKYQLDMTEYTREQNEAKAEAPKLQATIKDCEEKLKALGAELDAKQAPTLNQTNATTEEARDYNRRIEAIETRVENMMKALRAAPETLRYTHNIVEWEAQFYTVAELQETYTTTQTEIDKVHEQLKAESEKAGLPFPENWRHPQQDRMDAIKALVAKVKAVKEAAAKEAAAKATAAKTAKG